MGFPVLPTPELYRDIADKVKRKNLGIYFLFEPCNKYIFNLSKQLDTLTNIYFFNIRTDLRKLPEVIKESIEMYLYDLSYEPYDLIRSSREIPLITMEIYKILQKRPEKFVIHDSYMWLALDYVLNFPKKCKFIAIDVGLSVLKRYVDYLFRELRKEEMSNFRYFIWDTTIKPIYVYFTRDLANVHEFNRENFKKVTTSLYFLYSGKVKLFKKYLDIKIIKYTLPW